MMQMHTMAHEPVRRNREASPSIMIYFYTGTEIKDRISEKTDKLNERPTKPEG